MKKSKKAAHKRRQSRLRRAPETHAGGEQHRGSSTRRELMKGLFFIAVVFAVKLYIESTPFGHRLELLSYDTLQSMLMTQGAPVTVVDISDLAPEHYDVDGQKGEATPRAPLREMLLAVAEQKPKAIGVDIDFSPGEDGRHIYPRDPEFFRFCLELRRRGVPVFLGIGRTIGMRPDEWLKGEEYKELAANIIIPHDTRRMNSFIKAGAGESGHDAAAPGGVVAKSMSVLLADAYGSAEGDHSAWGRLHESFVGGLEHAGLIEGMSEKHLKGGVSAGEFLVDYGPLESIETIKTLDPAPLRDASNRHRLRDKVVLFGKATVGKATDLFAVPDRDHRVFPGVLLHACAAYTLMKAPLYEVTHNGRIALDIVMSLLILLFVIFIGHRQKTEEARTRMTNRARGLLTLFVVLTSLAVGVISVRVTRIMWADFFLALTLLVFHPSIERHVENVWEYVRERVFRAAKRKPDGGRKGRLR